MVNGTEVKFNTSLNSTIYITDLNFKTSNKKKYIISALTQGEIWFIVCWKYDKICDNGNGTFGNYVNEYSKYVKLTDFPKIKKLIDDRFVDKNTNHNDDILQSVQKYINMSRGEYHIEYITVKGGDIITDYKIDLCKYFRLNRVLGEITSYIYQNGQMIPNMYNLNVKILGRTNIYKWRSSRIQTKMIVDKISSMSDDEFKNKINYNKPRHISYIKGWLLFHLKIRKCLTIEQLYSLISSCVDSNEGATELLQLEI